MKLILKDAYSTETFENIDLRILMIFNLKLWILFFGIGVFNIDF